MKKQQDALRITLQKINAEIDGCIVISQKTPNDSTKCFLEGAKYGLNFARSAIFELLTPAIDGGGEPKTTKTKEVHEQ